MNTRRVLRQRRSRKAGWSLLCALLGALLGIGAIAAYRADAIGETTTAAIVGFAAFLAILAIIIAFVAFAEVWRHGVAGFGAALTGLVLALVVVAYPALLAVRAVTLPWITDLSTDPADPPLLADHAGAPATTDAFPRVRSHDYRADPAQVFAEVQALVAARGWTVVSVQDLVVTTPAPDPAEASVAVAPAGEPITEPLVAPVTTEFALAPAIARPGLIQAVARTPLAGFPEDVVLRVQPLATGTRVDMRAASRNFTHDFGSSARRIEAFLADLDARLPGLLAEEDGARP